MRTKSLLRREEYRQIATLILDGKILDIGGSKKSGYHELIGGDHRITSANIDPAYGVDVVFDAETPWPVTDRSYDAVLFINVLEHLYAYQYALDEAHRVLTDRGWVVGVIPFLFNVHGSPHDFHRFTRSALERHLAASGFVEIEIRELGTGAFSVIYHCLLGFVRWQWMASLLIPAFVGIDRLLARLVPGNKMGPTQFPLGYFFTARKPTGGKP